MIHTHTNIDQQVNYKLQNRFPSNFISIQDYGDESSKTLQRLKSTGKYFATYYFQFYLI